MLHGYTVFYIEKPQAIATHILGTTAVKLMKPTKYKNIVYRPSEYFIFTLSGYTSKCNTNCNRTHCICTSDLILFLNVIN